MFTSPFSWIRNKIRSAVIEGFMDGLATIDQGDLTLDTSVPSALLERLRPLALPASPPAPVVPAPVQPEAISPPTPTPVPVPPPTPNPAPLPETEAAETPGRRRKSAAA